MNLFLPKKLVSGILVKVTKSWLTGQASWAAVDSCLRNPKDWPDTKTSCRHNCRSACTAPLARAKVVKGFPTDQRRPLNTGLVYGYRMLTKAENRKQTSVERSLGYQINS